MTGSLLAATHLRFLDRMSSSCISVSALLECIHFPAAFRPWVCVDRKTQVLLFTQYCRSSYMFLVLIKLHFAGESISVWFLKFAGSGSGYPWEKPGWLAPFYQEPRRPVTRRQTNTLKQDLDNSCSDHSYSVSPICSLTP